MPTLHVLQGPDKGRTYTTPNEPAMIGRSSDQIHLSDHSASRHHAEIYPENGYWLLADLNSSNGTYLNGERVVAPTLLKYGDQIKVGSTLLVFAGPERTNGAPFVSERTDVDLMGTSGGSSILTAVNASEESVILQPPETADAVAAWNVVYKIAEMAGTSATTETFLERVADIILAHIAVDHLVVLMSREGAPNLVPQVLRFRGKDQIGQKIVTSQTIINHVLVHKDGVLCANTLTDDRFAGDGMLQNLQELGPRSIICVPIRAHEQLHGVFYLDSLMAYHIYTEEQLRLAMAIGRLTGMAIENAQLLESRVRNERLAATGETVAYLSHYIRNILQGMQSGAEVIELGLKRNQLETSKSGWTLMRRNLDHIFELTMNMLTFSKDRQPRIENAQLNKIVADVVSLAQGRADEKSVMLLVESEDIPAVPLDPEGMHQVIHNILLNGIEAAPARVGRVNVRTWYDQDKGEVVLSISDNGPGIPCNEMSAIFEAFHSSKGQSGTGLGLAAAKKIIDEMNGHIGVSSGVGEGATFVVRIPSVHVRLADSDETHGPDRG